MRLIMMGTGPFAVPTFRALLDSDHQVAVLVTRPTPATRSRRQKLANPMRQEAERQGIAILDPADVNSQPACEQLAALRAELLVVCDYGQILAAETLALAPLGGINLHGSLLPRYRGAAPVNWALLSGETETGVTVIQMTPGLDAGPCLVQRRLPIQPQEDAEQLERRLAELGPAGVQRAIELLAAWDGTSSLGTPQNPDLATRAPRLKKSDGLVDWSRPAAEIYNQVRGLKPWPGTFTSWQNSGRQPLRLILDQVSLVADSEPAEPGTVVKATGSQLWVATGHGTLAIDRLQPAGKRVMEAGAFLRGHPLQPGMRLSS